VALYGRRRFGDAVDSFLRVIQVDPSVEQPYVFLARLLDHAEDRLPRILAAYAAWEKAAPANPLPPCLYPRRSAPLAAIRPNRIRAAPLHPAQPRYWESHFELGVLMEKKADWPGAAAELKRSLELNPTHAPAHFQLARAYTTGPARPGASRARRAPAPHRRRNRRRGETAMRRCQPTTPHGRGSERAASVSERSPGYLLP